MAGATFLKGEQPTVDREPVTLEQIERARAGDHEAFSAIFNAEEVHVRNVLFRLLGLRGAAEVDDLEQEVFVRIATTLSEFHGTGSFRSWVAAIAVNVARNHFRRPSVRLRGPAPDASSALMTDVAAGAHVRAESRQLLERIERALDRLSPNHRVAITLRMLGNSVDEIAALTHSARSTTRLRLYYARRALRKELEREGGQGSIDLEEG